MATYTFETNRTSIPYDTPLIDAADILDRSGVATLPVVQNGVVVGMVSEQDIVERGVFQDYSIETTRVRRVMTPVDHMPMAAE